MHSSEHKGTEKINKKNKIRQSKNDNWFREFVSAKQAKREHTAPLFRSQEGTLQIEMTRYQHMRFKPRAEPAVAKIQIQLRAGSMPRNNEFTKDQAISQNKTQTHTRTPQQSPSRTNVQTRGREEEQHYKAPQVDCLAFLFAPLLQRNAPFTTLNSRKLALDHNPTLQPLAWPELLYRLPVEHLQWLNGNGWSMVDGQTLWLLWWTKWKMALSLGWIWRCR